MNKYRIIYVDDGSPCHWQLQKRTWLFFWKNVYLSFSSVTTAANELLNLKNDRPTGLLPVLLNPGEDIKLSSGGYQPKHCHGKLGKPPGNE